MLFPKHTRKQHSRPKRHGRRMILESLERRELLTTLAWSAGPNLPAPRTDAVAVVAADNAVHILGGEATSATAAPQLVPNGTSWVFGQKIDTQRNDLGVVKSGTSVFLIGGTGNTEGSDEVLSYDYQSGDSQDVAKMGTVRYDFGFAADSSGRAYAIGGIGVRADGEIWSSAERYTPSTNTWSSIAALPQPLRGLSAVGDGKGHIYVFGGSTTLDDSGIQDKTYVYDIAADTWGTVASMPEATRDSAVVLGKDGAIFVLGGKSLSGATDAVQVYDPATNAWSSQTALPQAIYSHAAAFDSQGRILVAGGFDSTNTAISSVYRTQNLNISETAPIISSNPVAAASLDRPYSYDVNAAGNPAPTFSLLTAPNGMTIDSATGIISWQPSLGQLGTQSVSVRASNQVGTIDQSFDIEVVADTIAPTVPANLAVNGLTETSATLAWTASTDAVGVDHYEVYSVVHRRQRWRRWNEYTLVATVPQATTTATFTGLTPLSNTFYVVRAYDAAGNISDYSSEVLATTLSVPDLRFLYGTQSSGAIQSPAKKPISIQLLSRANPTSTFSMVSGPSAMTIDSTSGLVLWTPAVGEVGPHSATFRATNSVGSVDLTIDFSILSDAPQLSVDYSPNNGGQRNALAGTLFTVKILDGSNTPPAYQLVTSPAGMVMDEVTGLITWTPTGNQGGNQTVTVRGTNSGGSTDITFNVETLFTGTVTNVGVTGTTLLEPTANWTAPAGEGSNLVTGYLIDGVATWGVGRNKQTHRVSYTVPAAETSVQMAGLVTGKSYSLTVMAVNAVGDLGLPSVPTVFSSVPALPQVRWSVNGFSGGLSTPGPVVAGNLAQIVLTDVLADPSTITLVSGPTGLTYNPVSKTADWTPGAADVTPGYSSTLVTFQATNRVGSTNIVVPIRVFFSGAVPSASTTRYGNTATGQWTSPIDNVTPVVGYKITRHWTWSGRARSVTWNVGNVNSITFSVSPTGAVVHKGIEIQAIDANGNLGISTGLIRYGSATNNVAPVAANDTYSTAEDVSLVTNGVTGVLTNDIDTDNTPFINPLSARLVTGPANGVLQIATTGSFTYVPNANFHGVDTFTYLVNDGKFNSNVAIVTINVNPVNDAPSALDDNYTVDQDNLLTVAASNGVLNNDADVDGDGLTVTLASQPTNGTVSLATDGSFVYTPAANFSGTDSFTYVANDSALNSRTATVSIGVKAAVSTSGTKFFVVDYSARGTFEYQADGALTETYGLPKANKKPLGVATNADGSLVWVVDKQKKVFVYDNAGNPLANWVVKGVEKPEGITTDGTDLWIVDRSLDTVSHFVGGASLRNGSATPSSSFALDRANKNPKGITTDGTNIWVVNNKSALDEVFKYTTTGQLVGRWTIDAANRTPTGITIDPNHVKDVWIIDSGADRVFQYNDGATRTTGSATASSSFELASPNKNPQGIADPRALELLGATDTHLGAKASAWSTSTILSKISENLLDLGSYGLVSPTETRYTINDSHHQNQSRDVVTRDIHALDSDPHRDRWVAPLDSLIVNHYVNRQSEDISLPEDPEDLAYDLAFAAFEDLRADDFDH